MPKRGYAARLIWNPPPVIAGDAVEPPKNASEALKQAIERLGLPEVPASHNATPLSEAIFLLRVAAEIEHGLLIQYLYAAYSIDGPAASALGFGRWFTHLRNIAIQEMFHLVSVENLLLSLGSTPYIDRADFPVPASDAAFYPFPFALEPLSRDSLAKYVIAESPPTPPAGMETELNEIATIANATAGATVGHVGVLYAKLYWLFQPSDAPTGPISLDPAQFPTSRHLRAEDFAAAATLANKSAKGDEFEGDSMPTDPHEGDRVVWEVTDSASALLAFAQIAIQGEGWDSGDSIDTHFELFLSIYRDAKQHLDTGGKLPVFPAPKNPNTTAAGAGSNPQLVQGRIDHPETLAWAKLLNLRYRILLTEICLFPHLSLAVTTETELRGKLVENIFTNMRESISVKTLSKKLFKLPQTTGNNGQVAGPPFEIPGSIPEKLDELKLSLKNLFVEAATVIDQILAIGSGIAAPSATEKTNLQTMKTEDEDLKNKLN